MSGCSSLHLLQTSSDVRLFTNFSTSVLTCNAAIDPTKLTKGRQFQKTSAPSRNQDMSLWTETPAERQQRLADELSGKRRRAVNADPDAEDDVDARKRRRYDEEVRKGVDAYTVVSILCCINDARSYLLLAEKQQGRSACRTTRREDCERVR